MEATAAPSVSEEQVILPVAAQSDPPGIFEEPLISSDPCEERKAINRVATENSVECLKMKMSSEMEHENCVAPSVLNDNIASCEPDKSELEEVAIDSNTICSSAISDSNNIVSENEIIEVQKTDPSITLPEPVVIPVQSGLENVAPSNNNSERTVFKNRRQSTLTAPTAASKAKQIDRPGSNPHDSPHDHRPSFARTSDAPGPGTYDSTDLIGKGRSFLMSQTVKEISYSFAKPNNVPGPGAYQPATPIEKQNAKFSQTPKDTFKVRKSCVPGPGFYGTPKLPSKEKSHTFQRSVKTVSLTAQSPTDARGDPGWYSRPSNILSGTLGGFISKSPRATSLGKAFREASREPGPGSYYLAKLSGGPSFSLRLPKEESTAPTKKSTVTESRPKKRKLERENICGNVVEESRPNKRPATLKAKQGVEYPSKATLEQNLHASKIVDSKNVDSKNVDSKNVDSNLLEETNPSDRRTSLKDMFSEAMKE
eukprot:370102_1